jgi:hypothetical protein
MPRFSPGSRFWVVTTTSLVAVAIVGWSPRTEGEQRAASQPLPVAPIESPAAASTVQERDARQIMFGDIYGTAGTHRRSAPVLAPVFVKGRGPLPANKAIRTKSLPPGCEGLGSIVSELGAISGRCIAGLSAVAAVDVS